MTKKELVDQIKKSTGYRRKPIEDIVESMLSIISKEISDGGKVYLSNFGVFETKRRKSKVGRNIRTKEEIIISEKTVASFRPSKSLADAILDSEKKQARFDLEEA